MIDPFMPLETSRSAGREDIANCSPSALYTPLSIGVSWICSISKLSETDTDGAYCTHTFLVMSTAIGYPIVSVRASGKTTVPAKRDVALTTARQRARYVLSKSSNSEPPPLGGFETSSPSRIQRTVPSQRHVMRSAPKECSHCIVPVWAQRRRNREFAQLGAGRPRR